MNKRIEKNSFLKEKEQMRNEMLKSMNPEERKVYEQLTFIGNNVDCLPGRVIISLDYVEGKKIGNLILPDSVANTRSEREFKLSFEEYPYQGVVVATSKIKNYPNGNKTWARNGDWVLLKESFGAQLEKGYIDKVMLFGKIYLVVNEADIICRVPSRDSICTTDIIASRVEGRDYVSDEDNAKAGNKESVTDQEPVDDFGRIVEGNFGGCVPSSHAEKLDSGLKEDAEYNKSNNTPLEGFDCDNTQSIEGKPIIPIPTDAFKLSDEVRIMEEPKELPNIEYVDTRKTDDGQDFDSDVKTGPGN